jgi:hypothetical protein
MRQLGVSLYEFPLDLNGTIHRIYCTYKLYKNVIPLGVCDLTSVLLDKLSHC